MPINDKTSRIIKMFCCDNTYQWELMDPCVSGGYIYATDSFTGIKVKTDLPDDEVTLRLPPSGNKNMGKHFPLEVFKKYMDPDIAIHKYTVKISAIKNLIDQFETVPVMDHSEQFMCSECNGEGVIECSHCNHEYECPNCDGEGTIGRPKPTNERKFKNKIYVLVDNITVISGDYLIRIYEVAKELRKKSVEFQFSATISEYDSEYDEFIFSKKPLLCQIGKELSILTMPIKTSIVPEKRPVNVQFVML